MTQTNNSTTRITDLDAAGEQPDEGRGVLVHQDETAFVILDARRLKAEVRLMTSADSPTARSILLLAAGLIAILAMATAGSLLATAGATAAVLAATAGGLFAFAFGAGLYALFHTPRPAVPTQRRHH
ncbi:hypothetical protein AB0M29_42400 [Streptomyces sp. NPDC051976]|uniref:hypothetical protein n=1 Tax=Streptomyces sp. NPDC051976 TaxID=3154947 RepID=UPI00341C5066